MTTNSDEVGNNMLLKMNTEEWTRMMATIASAKAKRAEKMPDEQSAIAQISEAVQRLKELGWEDATYCPKDGTVFSAIEAGSSGIHECNYTGEWPNGSWWVYAAGDVWPARPILWRPRGPSDPKVNLGPIGYRHIATATTCNEADG